MSALRSLENKEHIGCVLGIDKHIEDKHMDLNQNNEITRKLTAQLQIAKPVFKNPLDEQLKQLEEINRENYRRREEERLANIETAENTAEMKDDIKIVIHNQNSHIALLEQQLEIQNQQIEIQNEQLQVLKGIFSSTENEVEIEEQLKELVRQQIDSHHPLWDYLKDKGGDVAIVSAPVLYKAFKALLLSAGITI